MFDISKANIQKEATLISANKDLPFVTLNTGQSVFLLSVLLLAEQVANSVFPLLVIAAKGLVSYVLFYFFCINSC